MQCPSTRAFSPQHKSHSKSWDISECEVYRPINHINIPLSLVIDSQMYQKLWKHHREVALKKGELHAIQFNLIQQTFIGCLVCDSQCLAPEIEK